MRGLYLGLVFFGALLLTPACERDFEAPPPDVTIESFDPPFGFMGDVVVLCGRNFSEPQENNSVYFGTSAAEIVPDNEPMLNRDCSLGRLAVKVPELELGQPSSIKIQNGGGQFTAQEQFFYRGPGHPINDRMSDAMPIKFTPLAVSAASLQFDYDDGLELVVTADAEARMLSLVDMASGGHLDFGVCHMPTSTAILFSDIKIEYPSQIDLKAYALLMNTDNQGGFDIEPQLWSFTTTYREDREYATYSIPEILPPLASIYDRGMGEDRALRPAGIWPTCRDDECILQDLMAADGMSPSLALVAASEEGQDWAVSIPPEANLCGDLKRPVDLLAYTGAPGRSMLAVFAEGSEIWQIPLTADHSPRLLWPQLDPNSGTPVLDPPDGCSHQFATLAANRLGTDMADRRIYTADQETSLVQEYSFGGPQGSEVLIRSSRRLVLGSRPFDLASARFWRAADDGTMVPAERLYAATSDGIVIIDISDLSATETQFELPAVGAIPLPGNRGTSQSLTVVDRFYKPEVIWEDFTYTPDKVIFADMSRDMLIQFEAGNELATYQEIPLTTSSPQVAPSNLEDAFYLADPSANVVRLLDRTTGVQLYQFPLKGHMGFGTRDLTTAKVAGVELVLAPLSSDDDLAGRPTYDAIAYAGISAMGDLPPCAFDSPGGGPDDKSLGVKEFPDFHFHEMYFTSVEESWLQLVQYGHGQTPGWLKGYMVDPAQLGTGNLFPDQATFSMELPPEIQRIRLSPEQSITTLVIAGDYIYIQVEDPKTESEEDLVEQLDRDLGQFFADALSTRLGTMDSPVYLSAVALSNLGKVLVVAMEPQTTPDAWQRKFVETGGVPTSLFLSPDERRLYATHITEGRVSIIDLDCHPLPECISVTRTLQVDDYPDKVLFDRAGQVGYVTHYFNNMLTMIE